MDVPGGGGPVEEHEAVEGSGDGGEAGEAGESDEITQRILNIMANFLEGEVIPIIYCHSRIFFITFYIR